MGWYNYFQVLPTVAKTLLNMDKRQILNLKLNNDIIETLHTVDDIIEGQMDIVVHKVQDITIKCRSLMDITEKVTSNQILPEEDKSIVF